MNSFPHHHTQTHAFHADQGGVKIALSAPAVWHKAATVSHRCLRQTTPSIGQLFGQQNGHIAN
ncbi:MAG: hypothetical protein ACON4F_07760 [Candidatus Puniceispirillaceae bacterium]